MLKTTELYTKYVNFHDSELCLKKRGREIFKLEEWKILDGIRRRKQDIWKQKDGNFSSDPKGKYTWLGTGLQIC